MGSTTLSFDQYLNMTFDVPGQSKSWIARFADFCLTPYRYFNNGFQVKISEDGSGQQISFVERPGFQVMDLTMSLLYPLGFGLGALGKWYCEASERQWFGEAARLRNGELRYHREDKMHNPFENQLRPLLTSPEAWQRDDVKAIFSKLMDEAEVEDQIIFDKISEKLRNKGIDPTPRAVGQELGSEREAYGPRGRHFIRGGKRDLYRLARFHVFFKPAKEAGTFHVVRGFVDEPGSDPLTGSAKEFYAEDTIEAGWRSQFNTGVLPSSGYYSDQRLAAWAASDQLPSPLGPREFPYEPDVKPGNAWSINTP